MKYFSVLLVILAIFSVTALAQTSPPDKTKKNKELKFDLNEDGSHYVKGTFLNQVWLRYTQTNPGSVVDGTPDDQIMDIGLRRTRIQVFGQLTDQVFFYTQFGQNNLSYRSPRKQGLFFLDAIGEYRVAKEKLSLGAGLTGWNGVSRYASPSIGSILSLDAPLYQQATNDVNDQFVRKYSVYAKGQLGKLDYRVAVSKPMSIEQSTAQEPIIDDNALFAAEPGYAQFHGYFKYMFLDKESNTTPYQKGSYLGSKSVFNIGAGFMTQKDAMWHYADNGTDTVNTNLGLFAVDVFYDRPIDPSKGNAITAYAAYTHSDYGKNYIRNIGAMNPATGVNAEGTLNGPGSAFPTIGTGNTFYAQFGYLFRRDLFGKAGTLQPYISSQYSDFDLLDDPMAMYDGGVNWLIDGNRVKLSLSYQSRPIFAANSEGNFVTDDRKGLAVMQFQIAL
ncbi:hypothetical protein DN752_03725 [Echinicola strongylocentroti]|uniref:Porin n=1 Tax=Echinicola strongylocentroti TaxID=1795355 RepID=A0A2Z4IE22_9BACT|nr:hypothetical protein [Echinicola strongylocentroti]AWW29321.1 hypothetical protein DN752_03725 [Echinicola strongylocentroti]